MLLLHRLQILSSQLGTHVVPSSSAPPSATPWISHLQGEDGSFSVFPKAYCCHFPFGTCGVSLMGPCYETETRGAFPSCTLLLSTAWVLPAGLPGWSAREVSAAAWSQSEGCAGGRGASFPLQAPRVWQLTSPLPLQVEFPTIKGTATLLTP